MTLRESGWTDTNRARLERVVAELGSRSGRRVAVFDWDNTMIRGDVGDLVLAHLLERGTVGARHDAAEYALLTDGARAAMQRCAAEALSRDGTPVFVTERGEGECARVLAHLAWQGTLPDGTPGFTTPMTPTYRSTYGFLAQLVTTARTDQELRAIAREVWREASEAPVGRREDLGGVEVERFLRLNEPMVELAHALERAGVEVWIVSASPQPIVEVAAERAGIAPERVIGVRMAEDDDGRPSSRFAWTDQRSPVITWHEGKRRWIERLIGARPLFAAGDSDGDLAMLQDADVRLVLDRHALRVMCNALADPDRWIVQPLFHDPPPPRTDPYPCSTHVDALGGIVDPQGRSIADQPALPVDERASS